METRPVQIDMNRLLLQRQGFFMQPEAGKKSVELTEATKKMLTTLSESIQMTLAGHFSSMIVTNKGMTTGGFFVLSLKPDELMLIEQTGFQKLQYHFSIANMALKMNDRPVDDSFMMSFLNKCEQIANALMGQKAHLFGKPA